MVAAGSFHMAVDAWMLDQLITGKQQPTLRLYRWQPVAISLGYHQRQWPEHWQSLEWQGKPIDLVRRPTGGRAVLHQGDFTYAIALPLLSNRRQDLYQHICDALIATWKRLGVPLRYGTAGRGYHHQANCFAVATAADLVTPNGYKLIGSAQLRRDRYLLQQGTMRLWPNADLFHRVFGEAMETSQQLKDLPPQASDAWLQLLAKIIVEEIEKGLGVVFETQPLTPQEQQDACNFTPRSAQR